MAVVQNINPCFDAFGYTQSFVDFAEKLLNKNDCLTRTVAVLVDVLFEKGLLSSANIEDMLQYNPDDFAVRRGDE